MQKTVLKIAIVMLVAGLTGCNGNMFGISGMAPSGPAPTAPDYQRQGVVATSVDNTGKQTNVNLAMSGGGDIGLKSMDSEDRSKMSRALDAGTGKSTRWVNGATGISYTVTPIRKVEIQNNPFCREYSVQIEKGSKSKQLRGTACVTTDGSWHTM